MYAGAPLKRLKLPQPAVAAEVIASTLKAFILIASKLTVVEVLAPPAAYAVIAAPLETVIDGAIRIVCFKNIVPSDSVLVQ